MSTTEHTTHGEDAVTRRDMLNITATCMTGVGAALALWPFVHQMNPAADTLALATVEVDVSSIGEGEAIIVKWRGNPVFIRHRTPAEIAEAREVVVDTLIDRQPDEERILAGHDKWLVVIGSCTHLGCVPLGSKSGDDKGEYGGWYCPCHGSHYDTSGRIRKGPAPRNLDVPEYTFVTDSLIKLG